MKSEFVKEHFRSHGNESQKWFSLKCSSARYSFPLIAGVQSPVDPSRVIILLDCLHHQCSRSDLMFSEQTLEDNQTISRSLIQMIPLLVSKVASRVDLLFLQRVNKQSQS